tara:strand:- start:9013 stop:11028 length:2016 start_codon:yes stop_codon:yes gene_type:complete
MAIGDGKAKKEAQDINKELGFILDAVSSIGDQLVGSFQDAVDSASDLDSKVDIVGKTMQRGLVADLKQSVKNTESLIDLQSKVTRGVATQKDIAKEQEKIALNRARLEAKRDILGKKLTKRQKTLLAQEEEQLDFQEEALGNIKKQNTEQQKNKSLLSIGNESLKGMVDKLDKSGTLSAILEGKFSEVVTLSRLGELSLFAIGNAILKGSENMAKLAKTTGISKDAAFELQKSLNQSAIDSGNVAFTGEKATKAFVALSKETGLVADFGGQTLETFTMLTTKLGLAEKEASSLTTMARLQGKETEDILSDTVATASSLAKQAGVGINVKGVLEDVANSSNSIKISLGSNPELLAEAAANAALLGTNLEGVDAIASSLLDFEQSIKNELAAEMLLGKDINLEKARQLALNNDLAGLAEEIANQEEITASFASGNRVQQEAAAAALGMSRDALSDMVMKQQLNALSAEEFKNTYGEATYEQMQSVSAQEKLALSAGKMKDSIAQIGLAFAPFLDGLAKGVGYLAESKTFLAIMGGLMAGLAARQAVLATISFATAIPKIFSSFSAIPFGLGIPGAIAAIAGMAAAVKGASSIVGTVDDMVAPPGYGDRILSTPAGSLALNNQDTVVAGTNLGGGGDMKETNALLNNILNKQGTVKMNATSVGTAFSVNSRQIQ